MEWAQPPLADSADSASDASDEGRSASGRPRTARGAAGEEGGRRLAALHKGDRRRDAAEVGGSKRVADLIERERSANAMREDAPEAASGNPRSKVRVRDLREGGKRHLELLQLFAAMRPDVEAAASASGGRQRAGGSGVRWQPALDPEFVRVAANGLTAVYSANTYREGDRSDPTKFNGRVLCEDASWTARSGLSYYEVTVRCEADTPIGICMGLSTIRERTGASGDCGGPRVGTLLYSYGYCGADGALCASGEELSPHNDPVPFGNGDVVGCGVAWQEHKIFFTLNGELVAEIQIESGGKGSNASQQVQQLLPCASLHNLGESVSANFGPDFSFDVAALHSRLREQRRKEQAAFEAPEGLVSSLVEEYLFFNAYEDTLRTFRREAAGRRRAADGGACDSETRVRRSLGAVFAQSYLQFAGGAASEWPQTRSALAGLSKRNRLRRFIMQGKPLEALRKLQQTMSPPAQAFLREEGVFVALRQQHFVELVRAGDPAGAVAFARAELEESQARPLVPLVAYKDAASSPLGSLLHPGQREAVAHAINEAVLRCGAQLSGQPVATSRPKHSASDGALAVAEVGDLAALAADMDEPGPGGTGPAPPAPRMRAALDTVLSDLALVRLLHCTTLDPA